MPIIKPIRKIPHPKPERYSQIAFLSLVPWEDGYIGAYREFTPEKSDMETRVMGQRYSNAFELDGKPWLIGEELEDPRIFLYSGKPLVLAAEYAHDIHDWLQILCHAAFGTKVAMPYGIEFAGKNWMPVTGDNDDILLIRSIDPLCILKSNPKKRPDFDFDIFIGSEKPPIGEYRGGAAATIENGIIRGFGHRTITDPELRHIPFEFQIDAKSGFTILNQCETEGFGAAKILDPTSILGDDKIIICAADKTWWNKSAVIESYLCQIS